MKHIIAVLALVAIAALPMAQPADAASKRQAKVAICHFSEDEDQYVRIKVAERAAERHLAHHEFDVAGDGVDCSALPDPTPDEPPV